MFFFVFWLRNKYVRNWGNGGGGITLHVYLRTYTISFHVLLV